MGALTTSEAYDALSNFASSYGPDPLLLLLHASVPETLRPDILHLIQINFLAGPADPSREADVLFAPFTTCLGGDYYRIDAQVRWHGLTLLRSLYREEPSGREVRVAELLWCHLEQLERGKRITAQTLLGDYIAVQRWVALAYLEPSDAARAFAQALRAIEAQSSADSSAVSITAYAQLGGLAAALELPLAGEPELLTYAKGLDALAKGDEPNATRLLEALGDQPLQIGEVSLKAPTQWLGHQVEERLRRQLEEQKKRELVEQQRQAEEVFNETEREPVAADPPEVVHAAAVVPTVGAIRLQSFSFTTCLLRKEDNRWKWSTKGSWIEERCILQVEGFLEQLEHEALRQQAGAQVVALTMVKIPSGSFLMGSPRAELERYNDEGPQLEVKLESFFMGQTPITQAQWREVAGWQEQTGEKWGRQLKPDPSRFQSKEGQGETKVRLLAGESNTDHRPVEEVSWLDAMEFCSRLSQRTGLNYTLPSEAQWEYACRAGTTTPFCFGDTITAKLANYDGRLAYADGPKGVYRVQTTPVGMFPANGWGMHDMHANVSEWCADHWHPNYIDAPDDGSPRINPNAKMDERRLLRGGSWDSSPRGCRSAYRSLIFPDFRSGTIGFRVCCLPQD
ncbi:MAG: formylglycine-generating enzyme family protein [Cyanobacteria bacterium]|nr:formylglycine-generating enzyme family protein [Cyanobacteriota bacterium]